MNRTRITKRRFVPATIATIAASVVLLSGCSSQTPDASISSTPVAGGTLRVQLSAQPNCLDPAVAFSGNERAIARSLADSLLSMDPKTGEIKPWLAESFEESADATSYTFHLKSGATFSDGTAVDANAVKSTFDYLVAHLKTTSSRGAGYLRDYTQTEVIDPLTAKIGFKAPAVQFLAGVTTNTLAILSTADTAKTPDQRCAGDFSGSGPFTLKSFTQGQGAVIVKRAGYDWAPAYAAHSGEAYLDEVDFQVVNVSNARDGALTSGQADVALDIANVDVPQLKAAGVTPMFGTQPGMPVSFLVNSATPGLSDPAVYGALTTGFDRSSAVKAVLGGYFSPATSALTHNLPQYKDESALLTYDPDAAKKALDAAGWVPGADGIREKGGVRADFTVAYTSTFGAYYTAMLQLFQQQMRDIGININIGDHPQAELLGLVASHGYDFYITSLTDVDPDVIRSSASRILDANTLTSSGVADLFNKTTTEADPAARKATFGEVQDTLIGKGMVIPFWEGGQFVGYTSNVMNLGMDFLSYLTFYDTSVTS
jgi:peptide/nickel transport system substrate-binding protein